MRSIASLALTLALLAAPAAFAAAEKTCPGHAQQAKATCCAKKADGAAADKKCDPATCEQKKKCTPEQKAKCDAASAGKAEKCDPSACQKKAEAPKPPKA